MCHLILLMPVFGLVLFWILPFPVAMSLYIVILIVSIFLYYKIMKSMMRPVKTGGRGLIGLEGDVIEASDKYNLIRVHGELWKAESQEALSVGTKVKVNGMKGLVLEVSDNIKK